ncbi:hypothetical protein EDEG_01312 [Edhazardia aedis USNM 41457]|uniref:RING-type domain-containing protein n=1 Tax=Edhazardia aedis (strain USNM 41457) TaxID=1003232 RepID=J9DT00_EDHAE|nr:hypothetical protein EDEG_01312 [Edhazardia aedis USNM 41457]|eukprot:EJW04442.1 hypothetical protein EDEG_01312 [Edhazardia aedis USNM 41457]
MKDAKHLQALIYCHKCYKKRSDRLYIGECMHIICHHCFKTIEQCVVCHSKSNFIILEQNFIEKLLKNPAELFQEPIESLMFQLSSALNLIMFQKVEIERLKKNLEKAKNEITKIKSVKNNDTDRKKLFKFQVNNNAEGNNNPKNVIDKIYYANNNEITSDKNRENKYQKNEQNKHHFQKTHTFKKIQKQKKLDDNFDSNKTKTEDTSNLKTFKESIEHIAIRKDNLKHTRSLREQSSNLIKPTKNLSAKGKYLMDLTNTSRKKYFTDYDPANKSLSSSRSTRITLPPKDPDFKYVYRRQNGF